MRINGDEIPGDYVVKIHPNYSFITKSFDLALITFSSPSSNAPICMPLKDLHINDFLFPTYRLINDEFLIHVRNFSLIDRDECFKIYYDKINLDSSFNCSLYVTTISENQFCSAEILESGELKATSYGE